MIVSTEDLAQLHGRVTMVDGGFDPLHPGHVAYFRAAADLGHPVLCNVSADDWVARKHAPLLSQADRVLMIDALRDVAYVHASSTASAEVIELAQPRIYAKGADWRGRLPADEEEACARLGVEIVFLDTVLDSSSAILERWRGADA